MDDVDRWVFFDGPEPESLRPLLDAIRETLPAAPRDKQAVARRLFARLDAMLAEMGSDPTSAEEDEASDAGSASGGEPSGEPWLGGDGATARSPEAPEVPAGAAGSEGWERGSVVVLAPAAEAPAPASGRAPEGLKSTAAALEIPAEVWALAGRLPFRPPGAVPGVGRTLQVPVWRRSQGETAPIGDDSIAKARDAVPFVGAKGGAAVVPVPRLTVQEYASLRAELAVRPDKAGEILRRYRVANEEAGRALVEEWERWFAERPGEREAYERLVGEYVAWVRMREGEVGRGGG